MYVSDGWVWSTDFDTCVPSHIVKLAHHCMIEASHSSSFDPQFSPHNPLTLDPLSRMILMTCPQRGKVIIIATFLRLSYVQSLRKTVKYSGGEEVCAHAVCVCECNEYSYVSNS